MSYKLKKIEKSILCCDICGEPLDSCCDPMNLEMPIEIRVNDIRGLSWFRKMLNKKDVNDRIFGEEIYHACPKCFYPIIRNHLKK